MATTTETGQFAPLDHSDHRTGFAIPREVTGPTASDLLAKTTEQSNAVPEALAYYVNKGFRKP